jgi:hypothetical protein
MSSRVVPLSRALSRVHYNSPCDWWDPQGVWDPQKGAPLEMAHVFEHNNRHLTVITMISTELQHRYAEMSSYIAGVE